MKKSLKASLYKLMYYTIRTTIQIHEHCRIEKMLKVNPYITTKI